MNGWIRVGRRVQLERMRRRWSRERLAQETGLSTSVIQAIEAGKGQRSRPATKAAVSGAFDWTDDSLDRIAAGADPEPVLATVAYLAEMATALPAEDQHLLEAVARWMTAQAARRA